MNVAVFQHPFVKDLAWLIEGHYIERDFDLEPYWVKDVASRLSDLDKNPTSLIQAVDACKSHFLGSYFETLFSFAIEYFSSLNIVLEHFQIESEGRTLGEVDMLIETPDGLLYQFEIAIKFYLERVDLTPHHWIGPNKNDSLLKKTTKAREHQLSILHTEEGRSEICNVAKGRTPHSSLLIFGRLYYRLRNNMDIEEWIGESEGGWVCASDFILLKKYFSHFQVLMKPHWMSFPCTNKNYVFFCEENSYNLVGQFLHDERPKHVVLWDEQKGMHRSVFVVPDPW